MTAAPGFHGKMPGRGDFVTRRLPRAFIDVWDGWLQEAVATSKANLGEQWLETYLNSPLWRFALPAGVAGEEPWVGVLMPSVDRVGRYFPLTIACALEARTVPLLAVTRESGWFEAAEELALSALEEDGFDLDAFDSAVEDLGPCDGGARELDWLAGGQAPAAAAWQLPLAAAETLGDACAPLLARLLRERLPRCTLWWSNGSDVVAPSLLLSDGLPAGAGYTALLDGQWQQWSWEPLSAGEDP